jgi:peroxiredoxin
MILVEKELGKRINDFFRPSVSGAHAFILNNKTSLQLLLYFYPRYLK